jgi:L-ascorbate metabolism protein UlaG (beta-lactamase superfamily)
MRKLKTSALAIAVLVVVIGVAAWASACASTGAVATGARRERVESSPQWKNGSFSNKLSRVDGPADEMMRQWIFGGSEHREPATVLPVESRTRAEYDTPPESGLRITWLGHSTLLVEIDGVRVLVDPVFSERASPFSFAGPKRWYAPPLPLAELPDIDVIVISHDHYDHLDADFVRAMASSKVRFAVPLGIGAHLESWGIAFDRIDELDWWEETTVGAITLTSTPARHFSGRWIDDSGQTLWCGWAMRGPTHRAYYSGDTAMFDGFVDVGEKLGPFDVTMLEAGAYDRLWADVHLGPEQAVRAHELVKGSVFIPVHWGLFDLALHGWTEPIERVVVAAERAGVRIASPKPGERIEPARVGDVVRWWPEVPWKTVDEAPAWSSSVEELIAPAQAWSREAK